MTAKAKIKIIKKGESKRVEIPVIVKKIEKTAAAREMVSTVSDWVSDFQKRKKEETAEAFNQLFAARLQTN